MSAAKSTFVNNGGYNYITANWYQVLKNRNCWFMKAVLFDKGSKLLQQCLKPVSTNPIYSKLSRSIIFELFMDLILTAKRYAH